MQKVPIGPLAGSQPSQPMVEVAIFGMVVFSPLKCITFPTTIICFTMAETRYVRDGRGEQ